MNNKRFSPLQLCTHLHFLLIVTVAHAIQWQDIPTLERVHVFYYLWYGNPAEDGHYKHWNHEILPHWDANRAKQFPHGIPFEPPTCLHSPFYPARGPYSSKNVKIIKEHMLEVVSAGIGVLALSWWGPHWRAGTTDTQGVSTDLMLDTIVRVAEDVGVIKLAFHLEPYPGRTALTIREDLEYLMGRFSKSASLLRINGQPVYYVYDSYRIANHDWSEIFGPNGSSTVRGTNIDGFFIGLWLEASDGDQRLLPSGFDGAYTYFASETVSYGSNPQNWAHIAKWCLDHELLFVASVGPGYNDSKIRPWNEAATRDRKHGERYSLQWLAAIQSGASLVSITSYNEWGEGTQIEPARVPPELSIAEQPSNCSHLDYMDDHGLMYINLTQMWTRSFADYKLLKDKTVEKGLLTEGLESHSDL